MKILIEIPKEFEKHFNIDRFQDSIEKCTCDLDTMLRYEIDYNPVAGKYDIEVLEMLIPTLENAKIIQEDIL